MNCAEGTRRAASRQFILTPCVRQPGTETATHPFHPASPLPAVRLLALVTIATVFTGCASTPSTTPGPVESPSVQSTPDQAAAIRPIARVRVTSSRYLPSRMISPLSPEFDLVVIPNRADWLEAKQRLGLPADLEVNLDEGVVVGILARVGENAAHRWPIRIDSIHTTDGRGAIVATFLEGTYFPIETAGYLELVYAPGLRKVAQVQIDSRLFTIRSGVHN